MHLALFENVPAGSLGHGFDVTSNAEEIAGPRQDHGMDAVIVAKVVPNGSQLADQLLIDRIARLWPVQRYRRHLVRTSTFRHSYLA